MAYGEPHNLVLPAIGTDTGVVGATKVNTALAALAATLDLMVTPAGIDINADLSFRSGGDYFGAKELQRVGFKSGAALEEYPTSLAVDGNGELYYVDLAGNVVYLSSDGSVPGAVGNITGTGYGVSGKEVNWDNTNADYRMRSGTGANDYADVLVGDLLLNDGSDHFARLSAGVMTADATYTLPTAVPASTSLMQMDSSGAMSASPTAGVVCGTVTASGLVTASAGVTASVNQSFTVSGTGKYKHGDRYLNIPPETGRNLGAAVNSNGYGAATDSNFGAADQMSWPVQLETGKRVKAVTVVLAKSTATSRVFTLELAKCYLGVDLYAEDVDTVVATTSATVLTLTITDANLAAVTELRNLQIRLSVDGGTDSLVVHNVFVTYDS